MFAGCASVPALAGIGCAPGCGSAMFAGCASSCASVWAVEVEEDRNIPPDVAINAMAVAAAVLYADVDSVDG